jgi:hypothetical protein
LLAKLKTIEKVDEKEAQRGASSLISKPPKSGTPFACEVRTAQSGSEQAGLPPGA